MIEVQVDVAQVDIIRMDGFPRDTADEDIYEGLLSTIQVLDGPMPPVWYLMTLAIFLTDRYESFPWRIIGVRDRVEVGRMEYLIPDWVAPSVPAPRVSRYQRDPVI